MRNLSILLLLLLACSPAALPQGAEADVSEVGAYAGGAFGLGGSHRAVGASFGNAIQKYVVALVDISYIPAGAEPVHTPVAGPVSKVRLYDLSGGVHVRIPLRSRIVPYVALGAGVLHSTYETAAGGASDNDFAFHTGAGLRYYFNNNVGVRPDFKAYVLNGRHFTRFTVGVFYQFP